MSGVNDSVIKLFGQTIPLSVLNNRKQPLVLATDSTSTTMSSSSSPLYDHCCDPPFESSLPEDKLQRDDSQQISDNPGTPSVEGEASSSLKSYKNGEGEQSEKTLKKPDKVLPCPRCKSMDTKFCYYNNYNVNHPRHFCKNCQRYWTAGGTIGTVPVGAGRRRNIRGSSASQYQEILICGSDSQLNESVASVLNGFHHGCEERILVSSGADHSNGSSEKGLTCGSAPQLPYFPGPPWNSPMPPPPALCPPGFALSFYPEETYWGCFLGKHSRDGNQEEPSRGCKDSERSVFVPKTLRIDDPSEAAKSSIWAALGRIKSNKTKNNTGKGLFKGFRSKSDDNNCTAETSAVLQANPAAFSRSRNFHESCGD